MSHSEPLPARKPRRLGLYLPLLLLAAVAGAWSLTWLGLKGEADRRLEATRAAWSAHGQQLSWASRRIYGFPFRLDVDFTDLRVAEPSGAALAVPLLQAEAFVFAPTRWIAVAPRGLIYTRVRGGPVVVTAKVLRVSLSQFEARPPRLSLEGLNLAFDVPAGGEPFLITAAAELHLHTRAGPNDQGAAFFQLTGAKARPGSLFARIGAGKPVDMTADLIWSHAAAMCGPDWPSAVRAWSAAGGHATVRRIAIHTGQAVLDVRDGGLGVGDDGRLRGALTASLTQAPRVLAALGATGVIAPETAATAAAVVAAAGARPAITLPIDFQAGQTTLGPVALAPAPRVY
jgi:hypothetical protein